MAKKVVKKVAKPKRKISEAQAKEAYAKAGSYLGAGRALGVNDKTVKRAMGHMTAFGSTERPRGGTGGKGRGLDEFRAQYDQDTIIPQTIKAALEALGDSWLPEAEFVSRTDGLTPYKWGLYRDHFGDHVVEVPGKKRIIAGTVEFAQRCREIV